MVIYLVERRGVEEAYVICAFSTEESAQAYIDRQMDPYMYHVNDINVLVDPYDVEDDKRRTCVNCHTNTCEHHCNNTGKCNYAHTCDKWTNRRGKYYYYE